MKRVIIIGSVLILLLVGFLYARRTSTLFNLLFPPMDMFVSLATKEADLSKPGKVQLQFQPKYPGYHEIDLEVEKFDFGKPFQGKVLLYINVKNGKGKTINTNKITDFISSFKGIERSGFVLQSFSAPEAIGIGEKGIIEISVLTPDKEFFQTYGKAKFTVTKGSDK